MFDIKKIDFEISGKKIEIETGKLAKQATAAVTIKCLDTVLLVSVTKSKEPRPGIDFFPLLVDFEEKHYSIGKIPGSFNRREGKASDKAVLVSRLIDRPIRPLFPKGYRNDIQVNITTLSVDMDAPPDTLAMLGAGFALELAGLPCAGPFGAVRVSRDENGEFVINPSEEEILNSDLDLVVAGTKDSIMMVEAGAGFLPEETVGDAIEFAHQSIKEQVSKIEEFAKTCGVEKDTFEVPEKNKKIEELVRELTKDDLIASMNNIKDKQTRRNFIASAKDKVETALAEIMEKDENDPVIEYLEENPNCIDDEIASFEKELLRKQIAETGKRADGRDTTEVRPLYIEVGALPRVHGDGLFTRGNTQVMSILSLGSERSARMLDGLDSEDEKFYMHNYNFPGWSVGEVKPNRGPGRREIGHGALAERALMPALPSRDDFPYAMRVVSEILESSGSTSMASVCASTLCMLNGGVPLKTSVAGVAMGLIKEGDKNVVLTDIHELEDFLGDMDFKVAGNSEGISALQMDIKIQGISIETLRTAIKQAQAGRLHILGAMNDVIAEPSPELKPTAPRVMTTFVENNKIGAVIGPSGKHIKWIIEKTGADINIDDEDGRVVIYCSDEESGSEAKQLVEILAGGLSIGEVWDAQIVKILENVGAIAEITPAHSGLIHISQIAHERVNDVSDYLKVGDQVQVKVTQIDEMRGRIGLSIKALTEKADQGKQEDTQEEEAAA